MGNRVAAHRGRSRKSWSGSQPSNLRPQTRLPGGGRSSLVPGFSPSTPSGLVLDYTLLVSTPTVTLSGRDTYYVNGTVNITSLTIEGGTVVKFTNTTSARIYVSGSVTCKTAPYRPAILTSKDDDTVGETIPGSTGTPAGYYGNPMLKIYPYGVTLENLRFRWAKAALQFDGQSLSYTHTLRHLQMVDCEKGLVACGPSMYYPVNYYAGNLLLHNVPTGFDGYLYSGTVEHLTAHNLNLLANGSAYYGASSLAVKNSVLGSVTNLVGTAVTLSGSYNGFYASPTFGSSCVTTTVSPFESVGAGEHYLAEGCGFQNQGTTNLNATLANDLKKRTTVAPP